MPAQLPQLSGNTYITAMTYELFWFSGTGNSLAQAKRLAEKITAGGDKVQLTPVAQALSAGKGTPSADTGRITSSADRIGLFFPVYYLSLPAMVKEFLERLDLKPEQGELKHDNPDQKSGLIEQKRDRRFFTVSSCGQSDHGVAAQIMKLCRQKGIQLDSHFRTVMPDNSIVYATPEEKHKTLLEAAEAHIGFMYEALREQRLVMEATGFPLDRAAGAAIRFWCDTVLGFRALAAVDERCVRCGLCTRICPAGIISPAADGFPRWNSPEACQSCFACIHHCPSSAIRFRRQSKGPLLRYKHPAVSVSDFFLRD